MSERITADDVLVAAGDELDLRGWTRRAYVTPTGEVCLVGGLYAADCMLRGHVFTEDGDWVMSSPAEIAHNACKHVVHRRFHMGSLEGWNDLNAIGPDDVHKVYELARKLLAEEGPLPLTLLKRSPS